MGRVIINGTLGQIAEPMEVDFDPVRGLIIHQRIKSAGDNLGGWANLFINEGIAFRWRRSPALSTIDYTFSGGALGFPDNAQTNWQLLGNEVQYTVYESNLAKALEPLAPPVDTEGEQFIGGVASVKQAVETGTKFSDYEEFLSDDAAILWKQLYGLASMGQTHFAAGQYVLKRSYSISNFFTGDLPNEENVEKIITPSAILTYGMPAPIAHKIESIPAFDHEGYLWGWRQLPSTMTTQAQNRIDVSTEWWLADWNLLLYDPA
jgi:hypothetical protein